MNTQYIQNRKIAKKIEEMKEMIKDVCEIS